MHIIPNICPQSHNTYTNKHSICAHNKINSMSHFSENYGLRENMFMFLLLSALIIAALMCLGYIRHRKKHINYEVGKYKNVKPF